MRVIDFRSDTVTQPTPEMREAMAAAEVGDDVMGEDPMVNQLEAMSAEMMGKEAALFVSSGTMGNLVSVLAQCQRGDEVIVGDKAHLYRAEAGGASVLGGVAFKPVPNDERGMIDPQAVDAAVRPDNLHFPRTAMVALENTHNLCGGRVLTPEDVTSVAEVARAHELKLHMDGARIFNAAVVLETPVAELVKEADTVTFCLSKGLSAPVGSVVCGSQETIHAARRWRKTLGGGMRQAGVIAAAGIVALETMVERMADDHANARRLARGLAQLPGISVDPDGVESNLVFFEVTAGSPVELARRLNERGIKLEPNERGIKVGPRRPQWRLATHHGIVSEDIDHALRVFEEVFGELAAAV